MLTRRSALLWPYTVPSARSLHCAELQGSAHLVQDLRKVLKLAFVHLGDGLLCPEPHKQIQLQKAPLLAAVQQLAGKLREHGHAVQPKSRGARMPGLPARVTWPALCARTLRCSPLSLQPSRCLGRCLR